MEYYYKYQFQRNLLAFHHERLLLFCLKVTEHYTPLTFEKRMQIGRNIFWRLAAVCENELHTDVMDAYLPEELHYKNIPTA